MFKKTHRLFVLCIFALTMACGVQAQNTEPASLQINAYDCTVVELEGVTDELLTKAERIAQMDLALQDSIDKHDQCVEQVVNNNAASGSGAGGGMDTGAGEGNGNEGDASANNTGGRENTDSDSQQQTASTVEQVNQQNETNNRDSEVTQSGAGAKNQEIDPKDNDSAVCRLLKDELRVETDPQKQSELKEIYSNYNCRG